jgi:hypothetical protein
MVGCSISNYGNTPYRMLDVLVPDKLDYPCFLQTSAHWKLIFLEYAKLHVFISLKEIPSTRRIDPKAERL